MESQLKHIVLKLCAAAETEGDRDYQGLRRTKLIRVWNVDRKEPVAKWNSDVLIRVTEAFDGNESDLVKFIPAVLAARFRAVLAHAPSFGILFVVCVDWKPAAGLKKVDDPMSDECLFATALKPLKSRHGTFIQYYMSQAPIESKAGDNAAPAQQQSSADESIVVRARCIIGEEKKGHHLFPSQNMEAFVKYVQEHHSKEFEAAAMKYKSDVLARLFPVEYAHFFSDTLEEMLEPWMGSSGNTFSSEAEIRAVVEQTLPYLESVYKQCNLKIMAKISAAASGTPSAATSVSA